MSSIEIKLITTPRYHLWNDALHARALAYQTTDEWHKGTYIRWTVTTAWTVLEICCMDALNGESIGNRFKDDVNKAIDKFGLSKINWGSGVWQQVLRLKDTRNSYTHISIPQEDLWPDISVAENAITLVRNAVKEIYIIANKSIPTWIDNDNDKGFK